MRDLDPMESLAALIGYELRRHRLNAGKTQEQVARGINYSPALVGSVETATKVPSLDLCRRCDNYLDTGGILERLWWHMNRQAAYPSWFWPFAEIEARAITIRAWEPLVIPGLLQTEDYARAIITAWQPGDGSEVVEQQVTARMERQKLLTRDDPPMLWVIIGEAALRSPVGSKTIMAEQLEHLLNVSSANSRIVLQVVPLSVGGHPGTAGPLELVTLRGEPDMAYLETQDRAHLVNDPDDVERYTRRYDMVRSVALSPDQSYELIAAIAKEDHT